MFSRTLICPVWARTAEGTLISETPQAAAKETNSRREKNISSSFDQSRATIQWRPRSNSNMALGRILNRHIARGLAGGVSGADFSGALPRCSGAQAAARFRLSIAIRSSLFGTILHASARLWLASRTNRQSLQNLPRARCGPCRGTCRCIRAFPPRRPRRDFLPCRRSEGRSPDRPPPLGTQDGHAHGLFRPRRSSGRRPPHHCNPRRRLFGQNKDSAGLLGIRPQTRPSDFLRFCSL